MSTTDALNYPWNYSAKGVTAYNRLEAQSFARQILESESYRASLQSRADSGTLPPVVEVMLWHYAYGKPVEQLHVTMKEDLSDLSTEELVKRAEMTAAALRAAHAQENAIDVAAQQVH